MSKVIGVDVGGVVEWHAHGIFSDYDTLCNLDADDPTLGLNGTVEAKRGQKIECSQCKDLFTRFEKLKLRASDFA